MYLNSKQHQKILNYNCYLQAPLVVEGSADSSDLSISSGLHP
jgi:hypothetical protein